jgi:hypothetical protein
MENMALVLYSDSLNTSNKLDIYKCGTNLLYHVLSESWQFFDMFYTSLLIYIIKALSTLNEI